jgi:acyl-CoA hydrolase
MKTHKTTFTVYPSDCNYMKVGDGSPMVHGGTMLLKMDRAAAELARQYLYNTGCDSALTVGVEEVKFLHGAKLGDYIIITVTPTGFGKKRMSFLVECHVEAWGGEKKLVATGVFSFCSFSNGQSWPHNITMNNNSNKNKVYDV